MLLCSVRVVTRWRGNLRGLVDCIQIVFFVSSDAVVATDVFGLGAIWCSCLASLLLRLGIGLYARLGNSCVRVWLGDGCFALRRYAGGTHSTPGEQRES